MNEKYWDRKIAEEDSRMTEEEYEREYMSPL